MSGSILVGLQFVAIALLLWPWSAMRWPLPAAILAVAGIALAVWTLFENRPGNFNIRPDVKPGARLITSGPYAHIRHPMYSALLLLGLAMVVLFGGWLKVLSWLALLAVLWAKSALEERALKTHFPAYRDYAAMVGRFLPRLLLG